MSAGPVTLDVVQPSARRREWELVGDGEVRARLRMPAFRSGVRAEAAGRPLQIDRRGRLRPDYLVHDEATGELVATLRRDGRRLLLEQASGPAEWKRLEGKQGHGFVDRLGRPLLRAKLRSGLTRTTGEIEVDAELPADEALVAALLACFLLIRRNDETAAAVAAAGAATV